MDSHCDMIPSLPGAGCVAEYWLNVHNNSDGDRLKQSFISNH
jgi:hypothetical protein